MVKIIPTVRPSGPAGATDPALAAVRALVGAAAAAMAVFDAEGECLVASPAFVLHSAQYGGGAAAPAERRVPFSPDGERGWKLASVAEDAGQPRSLGCIDVVANALPIMFNAKDTHSRYLFMNRYQADVYGIAPRDAVGRTAAELLGETYGAQTHAIDAQVLRSGRATGFYEEAYAGVDGAERYWLTSTVPLVSAAGAVWGIATVALDITERKRLEERLREAKEQAEVGSRAKSCFLANVSHELRTPLNAVIGFAEIMREEAAGPLGAPEYREYAGLILHSGLSLLDLINNLLDDARAEAGSLALNVTDVEVLRILRSAAVGARQDAASGRAAPLPPVDVEPQAGTLAIRGDEARLRQMLRALLGNALKFTPPGGRVTVRAQTLPGGGVEVVVADSRLGRAREGAGIGLRLARQLALLHGGTLTLESVDGQGTRAILRLPQAPPAPPADRTAR